MKLLTCLCISIWTMLLSAVLVSCTSDRSKPIPLASYNENYVEVTVSLKREADGNYVLLATFLPPNGFHLYSKDIPPAGVGGLGRPTLIELTPNSLMKATGPLIESVPPQAPDFEPEGLLVYPPGAVTLSLPVKLPVGDQWVKDEISVTYMACSASQCKPPVVDRIIPVRIPGMEAADIQ